MFESGVIVVKHWHINNYQRSDRKKSTTYTKELEQLELKRKQLLHPKHYAWYTNCQPDVRHLSA